MKKIGLMMLSVAGALGSAFAGSCPVDLDISALSASVEQVLIIRSVSGTVSTNTVTPAQGTYSDAILADTVYLVAQLKPGYKNARFVCEQEAWGDTPVSTNYVNSGSSVQFRSIDSVEMPTYVKGLLVDPESFYLTLDPNGGMVSPTSMTIVYDTPYGTLPIPTRTGYTFKGWTYDGKTWTGAETVKVLSSPTFTAEWEAHVYAVHFDPNGGSGLMSTQEFAYGDQYTLPENAYRRNNYHFDGWKDLATGKTYADKAQVSNLTAEEDGEVTLEAIWKPDAGNVEFIANGGGGTMPAVPRSFGDGLALPLCAFTRTGYAFTGWATTAIGEAVFEDRSKSEVMDRGNRSVKLYAVWQPFSCTVEFDKNGGTGSMSSQTFVYDQEQLLRANAFTLADHDFSCWSNKVSGAIYPDKAKVKNLSADQDGKVTLIAVWAPKGYKIRYHRNYSTDAFNSQDIVFGTTVTLSAEFFRSGYNCLGWSRTPTAEMADADCGCGSLVSTRDFEFNESGILDLYAVWKPYEYTVVFDANAMDATGTMPNLSRSTDDGHPLPNCAYARSGYYCVGWSSSPSSGKVDYSVGSTKDLCQVDKGTVRLYAVWKPVTYTIAFDADAEDATGFVNPISLAYNLQTNLPPCAFERDGYDFSCWTNKATGASFSAGAAVKELASNPGEAVMLFAYWKARSYTVALDANGGGFGSGAAVSNIAVTVGEPYGAFPAVTSSKPKYEFSRWLTRRGQELDAVVPPESAGITNLVARWKKINPLAEAVDAPALDFEADSQSYGEWRVDANGGDSNVCAVIIGRSAAVNLKLKTKVLGSGTLSFRWKILSEVEPPYSGDDVDPERDWKYSPELLIFDTVAENGDGIRRCGIAGNNAMFCRYENFSGGAYASSLPGSIKGVNKASDWTNETYRIEAAAGEETTLQWTFQHMSDVGTAEQRAWVDNIRWVQDEVTVTVGEVPEHITAKYVVGTETNLVVDGKFTLPGGKENVKVIYTSDDGFFEPSIREVLLADGGPVDNDVQFYPEELPDAPVPEEVEISVAELPEHVTALNYSFKANGVDESGTVAGSSFTVPGNATELKVRLVVEDGYSAMPASLGVSLVKKLVDFEGVVINAETEPSAPEEIEISVAELPEHVTALSYSFLTNGIEVAGTVAGSSFKVPGDATDILVKLTVEDGYVADPPELTVSLATRSVAFDRVKIASALPIAVTVAELPEHVASLGFSYIDDGGARKEGVLAANEHSFTVPNGARDVLVSLAAEDGYVATPASLEVSLETRTVSFDGVVVEPLPVEMVTVTVPSVANCTAMVVVAGVTNVVEDGEFSVPKGTAGVQILYVADEGYEPATREIRLRELWEDAEIPADEAPAASSLKVVTVTLPAAEHYSAVVEIDGTAYALDGNEFSIDYGTKNIAVVYVADEGWEPAEKRIVLADGGALVSDAEIPEEEKPVATKVPDPEPPEPELVAVAVAALPDHVTALNYSFKTNGVEVTGAVSGGTFSVPAEATDVQVQLVVEDGYTATPSTLPVDLASPSVVFDEVVIAPVSDPDPEPPGPVPPGPVSPDPEMVTVTVPAVVNYTAVFVVDGVTNLVENGEFSVEKGAAGVKVVYIADEGYEPATKEISLGRLDGDVEIPAGDIPSAPSLKKLTVKVPASEHYTALYVVGGVTNVVENGEFTVDYGTADIEVVYVADEGWEPAEKRIAIAAGSALVADAAVSEAEKPVAAKIPDPPPPMLEASGTVKQPKKLKVGKKATWKATPDNGCVLVGWTSSDAAGAAALANVPAEKLSKKSIGVVVVEGMTVDSIVPVWKRMDEVVPAGSAALMTWCDSSLGKVSKSVFVKLGGKKSVTATAKKGYVFAGWYTDPMFTTPFPFTDGKDFRKSAHSIVVNGNVHVFARFVPKTAAGDPVAGLTYVGLDGAAATTDVWTLGVPVEIPGLDFESASLPKVTMKGLPKGTKWNAKKLMITGTPKKEGVYQPIITVKNASKSQAVCKPTITVVARP